MRIILASASPRRKEILSILGINFEIVPSKIKEHLHGDPITTARRLSMEKALDVWRREKDALVIGADTLVFLGKEIIGKPVDEEDAFRILRKLSGRWHGVVTAVSFVSKGFRRTIHDVAKVKFRDLSDEEILYYISTGEPMDKAGAYGIQRYGATIVEKIRGNFFTVMGLPIVKVHETLKEFFATYQR